MSGEQWTGERYREQATLHAVGWPPGKPISAITQEMHRRWRTEVKPPVVGRLWCIACGELGEKARKPIGFVFDDPEYGLVYDAELPGAAEIPDDLRKDFFDRAHEDGQRLRFVSQGRCTIFLQHPNDDRPLDVKCVRHGQVAPDRNDVVEAVAKRSRKRPADIPIETRGAL